MNKPSSVIQLPIDTMRGLSHKYSSLQQIAEDNSDCVPVKLYEIHGKTGFSSGSCSGGQMKFAFDFFCVSKLKDFRGGETHPFKDGTRYNAKVGGRVKCRGEIYVVTEIIKIESTFPSAKAKITEAEVRKYMERETGHGMWLTEAYRARKAEPTYHQYRNLIVMKMDDLAILFWKCKDNYSSDGIQRDLVDINTLDGFDSSVNSKFAKLKEFCESYVEQTGQLCLF